VFFWYPLSERLRNLRNHVLIFDAAGLALFAVVGTQKALGYRLNPAPPLDGPRLIKRKRTRNSEKN
jgi:uncharacterized membrane protein YeiH